ncbi:MAG: IPT/TIG domain-containing protein [Actinomycetota bacterium]|nr:IPT/TIG domain-containing protein [Actinomycetota bacterium]
MSRLGSLLLRPLARARQAEVVRPRAFRHVALIATGFLLASSGVAYAYFSATGSGTYGLAVAGALNAPTLSVASSTSTSATLTWIPPSNPTGTSWQMRETGNAVSSGSCAGTDPSPTCTVTGLAPSKTYEFQLGYFLDTWHATSNTVTVTTTGLSEICGGGERTLSLQKSTTYTFTLLGGGGGKGGSTGATGGGGSEVHGSFTTPATGTVTLVYQLGCAGTPGEIVTGGNGGPGYAPGGRGGNSHTTKGSPGGGGGGGGASDLALEAGGTTTVIAVVGGGGGGGGGTKLTNKNTPQPGQPNTTAKSSSTPVTGQNGKTPSNNGSGGMGTGAGGGGAGTPAPSGGTGTSSTTTGKTAGKGGTGGYNYKAANGTVVGATVTITGFNPGSNPGQPGTLTLTDPPSGSVSPAVSVAAPTVTAITPSTGLVAGGTTVTITGTGFTKTATVSFGTTAATKVTVTSPTTIVATSPPAQTPGQVHVVVKDAAGTSATSTADVFTYVAPSSSSPSSSVTPTVTGISPATGPATGGTTVTITGTGFTTTKTTTVSFGTTTATSVSVTSATSITVTSPAHASGTVTVTVTTSGGTSATSPTDQFTYTAPPSTPPSGSTAGGTG